jgi:hypothetical protein
MIYRLFTDSQPGRWTSHTSMADAERDASMIPEPTRIMVVGAYMDMTTKELSMLHLLGHKYDQWMSEVRSLLHMIYALKLEDMPEDVPWEQWYQNQASAPLATGRAYRIWKASL